MRRSIVLILLCSALATLTSGCYDAMEIDDMAYVITIGVDKGVSDKLRLTVQMSTMQKSEGGGEGGSGGGGSMSGGSGMKVGGDGVYTTITVDAPSLYTGINLINTFTPRRLNLMHSKFLIFSEELAREGIGTYISAFIRQREIRRTMHVLVCKGLAMDFVRANKPTIGEMVSKAEEMLIEQEKFTGFFTDENFGRLYNDIKSTYNQPIVALGAVNEFKAFNKEGERWGEEYKTGGAYKAGEIPRMGGGQIEIIGTALFDGDKMVGELNGDETRMMVVLRGELARFYFTLQDPLKPEFVVPLDVHQARQPQVKIRFEGDKPVIDVKLQLEGDILAIQSRINYESDKLKPMIEEAFEKYAKNEMDKLIKKCQSLKVDVFNFGKRASMHFGTIQEWEKYNWIGQFEKAQISTEVKFTVRRTGVMLRSSPIISTEGKQ